MATKFSDDILERLRTTREVRIETSSTSGDVHRTIIWVVVDGNEAFIRSYRGARARWFRELTREGKGALLVDRDHIPVRSIAAVDDESIRRCSRAFEEKYRRTRSTAAMILEEVLDTTLRLEPA